MTLFNTPILFIIFNRPNTTRLVFEQIKKIAPKRLYVAADGPRENNKEDIQKCEETRNIIEQNLDWDCEIIRFYQSKNLGCKQAVYKAISNFFEHEEFGIILEDDCLPDISFFPFCESLLIKYKEDERIGHISGNNNFEGVIDSSLSYDFSTVCHIWGWATWRRVWKNFDLNFPYWEKYKNDPKMRKRLFNSLREEIYFSTFLSDSINNQQGISAWDAQYWFHLRLQHSLCIYPSINLVTNIGINSPDATHTKKRNKKAEIKAKSIRFPLTHPTTFLANKYLDDLTIRKRFFSYKRFIRYFLKRY